jgi:hypothetical protein
LQRAAGWGVFWVLLITSLIWMVGNYDKGGAFAVILRGIFRIIAKRGAANHTTNVVFVVRMSSHGRFSFAAMFPAVATRHLPAW